MIINQLTDVKSEPLFYELSNVLKNSQSSFYLKIEGLNIANSIKLKSADWIINSLEQKGLLVKDHSTVVCSSSGNFGVAVSIVCKQKNYPLICVTDVNTLHKKEKLMRLFGANVVKITKTDKHGGYLSSRIEYIQSLISKNSNYLWLNQYANKDGPQAHYHTTAKEIHDNFPSIQYLFIGAGTTGTLMGCASFFKKHSPMTKIIAVDALGSITFDCPPAKRYIPGLGTSRKPEILNPNLIDDIVLVSEQNTVRTCHEILNEHGLLIGGSSGSVISAVSSYQKQFKASDTIIAISPDLGHDYLDTIFDKKWVQSHIDGNTDKLSRQKTLES